MFNQDQLILFMSGYAYEPLMVYGFIILILTASSFGLPVPEEVTLISAGIIGYFALNPHLYPPESPGLEPINVWTLATVCFFAVFLSDLLIYWIGRIGGYKIQSSKKLARFFNSVTYQRAVEMTKKHGALMAGMFRFTPGLRFPGHLACGMLGVSHLRFWMADGSAALFSVPTQVLLIAYYGEEILKYFKQFKILILVLLVSLVLIYFVKRWRAAKAN